MTKRILVYGMTGEAGGMESYLLNYLRNLDRGCVTFDFITDCSTIAYADEIQKLKSNIYYIPNKHHLMKALREFNTFLKSHKEYEVVYFNILSAPKSIFMLPAIINKRVCVVHSHNGDTKHKILHYIARFFLNCFTDIKLACSEKAARFMFCNRAVDLKQVTLINNAIKLSDYSYNTVTRQNVRNALAITDEFVIGTVGRFTYQKNPFFILDIFREVVNNCPNAKLLWVGSGEMKNEIEHRAQSMLLKSNIHFLGVRTDVADVMQAFDIFMLPSRFEGLPVVGIEAQAAGLPCLFSSVITSEVSITDNTEFVSLGMSAEYWAQRVLTYQSFVRMATDAKIKEKNYDIESCAKKLQDIFMDISIK